MSTSHESPTPAGQSAHKQPAKDQTGSQPFIPSNQASSTPGVLLGRLNVPGRGNGPVRQAAVLQMQRTLGNRATRRLLAAQRAAATPPARRAPAASVPPVAIQRLSSKSRLEVRGVQIPGVKLLTWYDEVTRAQLPSLYANGAADPARDLTINTQPGNSWVDVWGKVKSRDQVPQMSLPASEHGKQYPTQSTVTIGGNKYEVEKQFWVKAEGTNKAPRYSELAAALNTKSAATRAQNIRKIVGGDATGTDQTEQEAALAMFGAETARNPRSYGVGLMMLDLVENQVKYGKNKSYDWEKLLMSQNKGGDYKEKKRQSIATKGFTAGLSAEKRIEQWEKMIQPAEAQKGTKAAWAGKWPMSPSGSLAQGAEAIPGGDADVNVVQSKEISMIIRWLESVGWKDFLPKKVDEPKIEVVLKDLFKTRLGSTANQKADNVVEKIAAGGTAIDTLAPKALGRLPAATLKTQPVPILAKLPPAALAKLDQETWKKLPTDFLTLLPEGSLSKLDVKFLKGLKPELIDGLASERLGKLPTSYLEAEMAGANLIRLPIAKLRQLSLNAQKKITPELAKSLPGPDLAQLQETYLEELPGDVLQQLSISKLSGLHPKTHKRLPIEFLATLGAGDLEKLTLPKETIEALPGEALDKLPVGKLKTLSVTALNKLAGATLAALPVDLLATLDPVALGRLPGAFVTGLKAPDLVKLPTAFLDTLDPALLAQQPEAVLKKLSPATLAKFPIDRLKGLPKAVLDNLPADVATGLPIDELLQMPEQFLNLPKIRIACLSRPADEFVQLPPAVLASYSIDQLGKLGTETLNRLPGAALGKLPAKKLAELSGEALQRLPPAKVVTLAIEVLRKLPVQFFLTWQPSELTQLAGSGYLDSDADGAILRKLPIAALKNRKLEALKRLPPDFFEAKNLETWKQLPATFLETLDGATLVLLPGDILSKLSATYLNDVAGADILVKLPIATLKKCKTEALQRLPTTFFTPQSLAVWKQLPAAFLETLDGATLGLLPNDSLNNLKGPALAKLGPAKLSGLGAKKLGVLFKDNTFLSALPAQALAGWPVPLLDQLPSTHIDSLSADHLGTLPREFLANLSPTNLARLPIAALAALPEEVINRADKPALGNRPSEELEQLPDSVLLTLDPVVFVKLPLPKLKELLPKAVGQVAAAIEKMVTPEQPAKEDQSSDKGK